MTATPSTVVITGAAGNLGRAVAQAFAAQGANLVLVDLHRDTLEKAFGGEAAQRLFAPANLLDPADAAKVVDAAVQRFGRVDALCNLAGGFRMGERAHETTRETWNLLFDLNVGTLMNMAHAAVPAMLRAGRGKIVNVGAYSAQKGAAQMGSYIAAKSAVIRLTETMAAELREQGINVNCVLPTIIDTPQNRADMPDADFTRWVQPREIAEVIAFLLGAQAQAVTGASIPVNGRV